MEIDLVCKADFAMDLFGFELPELRAGVFARRNDTLL